MRHKVDIVRVEAIGDGPDGTVYFRIGSNEYEAFAPWVDDFRGAAGRTIEADLHALDVTPPSWDADFRSNDACERRIVRTHGWNYEAYGVIRSIAPTVVDFGDLVLPMNEWTHDQRVVGAGIRVRIQRLEIWEPDAGSDP